MVSQKTPYLQANSINAAASSVLGVKRENYFSKRGYTIRQNIYIFLLIKQVQNACMFGNIVFGALWMNKFLASIR